MRTILLALLAAFAWLQPAAARPVLAVPCAVFGQPAGAPYACTCPADAPEGTVWGSDIYTADSNLCTAARHAGLPPAPAAIRVTPMPGQPRYAGTSRHGITTNAYEAYGASFALAPANLTAPAACPPNLGGLNGNDQDGVSLRCLCPMAAPATAGSPVVWGTDIYSSDSALCRAAQHAGAVGPAGGEILVAVRPGQQAFTGTRRHGVDSQAYGAWPAAVAFPNAIATMPTCPTDLANRPMLAGPLTCLCPAEYAAARTTHLWGTDVYTADSLLCPAAVHYGAIPVTGGRITMLPRPGQPSFPGGRRNAVLSQTFPQPFGEAFTFEGPPRGDVQPDVPVAAPVAQALQDRGTVALYIRFRTDSADLLPDATPALEELRDALRATPALRLRLVGHTDNTGQAARNRTLSLARAQSVQRWLVGQGIAAVRLAADGRGPDEPIADNATEGGRAVNRRTQAVRL